MITKSFSKRKNYHLGNKYSEADSVLIVSHRKVSCRDESIIYIPMYYMLRYKRILVLVSACLPVP